MQIKVTSLALKKNSRHGAQVLVLQERFLARGKTYLDVKVSNLVIFNKDMLGRFRSRLSCIIVKKRVALCHGPWSSVYIIWKETSSVTMNEGHLFFL